MHSLSPYMERSVPDKCLQCEGKDIVENWSEGNSVCRDCGVVVAERLTDFSSELRTFADDEGRGDPSRVSGPVNPLLDNPDYTGVGEGALSRTSERNACSEDRVMLRASRGIDTFLSRMNMSSTTLGDHAKAAFKQYYDAKSGESSKVRALQSMIAACIFIACRSLGIPRTLKELCALTGAPASNIRASVMEIELLVPQLKPQEIEYVA